MKKSTKRKSAKKQVQITISQKSDGGKSCCKCGNLSTASREAVCIKGRDFNARSCNDYDDVSVSKTAIFGGTTGMILGGTGRD